MMTLPLLTTAHGVGDNEEVSGTGPDATGGESLEGQAPGPATPEVWHADDCGGYPFCDGCGHIGGDGLWYPGPAPA